MEVKAGDKLILKRPIHSFGKNIGRAGDVFDVKSVDSRGNAWVNNYAHTDGIYYSCTMYEDEIDYHFDKYVEPEKVSVNKKVIVEHKEPVKAVEKKPVQSVASVKSVNYDDIFDMVMSSEFEITKAFDNTTVVAVKLPNGFVVVESSSTTDPEKYDEEIGTQICIERIIDKVWKLEAYRLKHEEYDVKQLWSEKVADCEDDDDDDDDTWETCGETDCDNCAYAAECFGDEEYDVYNSDKFYECADCDEKYTCVDSPYKK